MKTIYYHGTVYTGGPDLAQAFVVEDGRFVFAGTDAQALALRRPGDALADLGGQFVCSGFNDSHMHLVEYGYLLGMPQLAKHTGSLAGMLDCMRGCPTGTTWTASRARYRSARCGPAATAWW